MNRKDIIEKITQARLNQQSTEDLKEFYKSEMIQTLWTYTEEELRGELADLEA